MTGAYHGRYAAAAALALTTASVDATRNVALASANALSLAAAL